MPFPQDDPTKRLATEATVPGLVAAAIATDPTVANSAATMAQSTAGVVLAWLPTTSYAAGQKVVSPGGDIVSAKIAFTSGATYSAANWNTSTRTVTVTNTVGRRAFAWDADNNRAQTIYGNSGLRDISALAAPRTAGGVAIVRVGNVVELSFVDVALGTLTGLQEFSLIPSGFRPPNWRHFSTSPHSDDTPNGVILKGDGTVRIYGLSSGEVLHGTFTYYTAEIWPTALPGTAVGSIPA